MDEATFRNILSAHADGLNQGVDNTAWLLMRHTNGDSARNAELADMLALARRLKGLFVRVTPRPQFVTQLGQELMQEPLEHIGDVPATVQWIWWGAAVGSVAAGIVGFVFWRRGRVDATVM